MEKRGDSNKTGNEKEDITTDTTQIKRIIRDYMDNYVPINWIT